MSNELEILGHAIRRYYKEEASMLTPAEIRQHTLEAVEHYVRRTLGKEFVPAIAQPPIEQSWQERFVSMRGKVIDLEDKMRSGV